MRYDDPGITFDYENKIIVPSPLYQYKEGVTGSPVQIIYDPYPVFKINKKCYIHTHFFFTQLSLYIKGHYSAVSFRTEAGADITAAFKRFCCEPTAFNGCQVFLLMEAERKEMAGLFRTTEGSDKELRDAIVSSLKERKSKLAELIAKFKNALSELCNIKEMEEVTPKRDVLAMKLFRSIFEDDILFIDGEKEPLACGKGPLTKLFQGVKKLGEPPARTGQSSSAQYSARPRTVTYSDAQQRQQSNALSTPNYGHYQGIYLPKGSTKEELEELIKEPPSQIARKEPTLNVMSEKTNATGVKTPGSLLANPTSEAGDWKRVCMGNVIQARKAVVSQQALDTLLSSIADKTLKGVSEIEFISCEINAACYEKVSSFAKAHKNKNIIFTDCLFDPSSRKDIESRSRGKNVKVSENVRYKITIT